MTVVQVKGPMYGKKPIPEFKGRLSDADLLEALCHKMETKLRQARHNRGGLLWEQKNARQEHYAAYGFASAAELQGEIDSEREAVRLYQRTIGILERVMEETEIPQCRHPWKLRQVAPGSYRVWCKYCGAQKDIISQKWTAPLNRKDGT